MANTRRPAAKKTAAKNAAASRKAHLTAIKDAYDEEGVFDLDRLDGESEHEPFRTRLTDSEGEVHTFEFADFRDVDYFEYQTLEMSPAGENRLLRMLLGKEQYDELESCRPIPRRKVEAMFEAWQAHYGAPSPGEAGASPIS